MLELLNQVVREHSVLDLVNGSVAPIGNRFQASPHQQGAGNVVALNAGFATLTGFHTRQLFEFAVKLLNLPADTTHILYSIGVSLS